MGKIFKYLKKYAAGVAVIFVLLIVQAYCDLSLPDYTADILDTGIMQSGIDRVCPKVISESSLEGIELFMSDDEKKLVEDSYKLRDSIKDCDVPLADGTPEGKVYELDVKDKQTLDDLDEAFGGAVLTYSAALQMKPEDMAAQAQGQADADSANAEHTAQASENSADIAMSAMADMTVLDMIKAGAIDGVEMRKSVEEKYSAMSDTMIEQSAKAFWKSEYPAMGVDIDGVQKAYLFKEGGLMLAMAAVIMLCTIAICYLAAKIGAGVGLDLRVGVFKKVISFSNAEIDKFSTSSLITRSTNDIQQIQMVLTMMLRMVLYAPILCVGGIVKVLSTNTSMVWIIGVAIIAVLAVVFVLMKVAMPKFRIMQTKVDKLNLVTREILTGLPVIRAFSREKYEEQRFDDTNKDLTKTMLFTNRVMTFMMPVMMLIMNAISVLIVWVASKQIDMGNLQVGSMIAFITYSMMIIMSFLMLSMMSVMLPRASVAAQRVDEIITTESSVVDSDEASDDVKIEKGEVRFEHVDFHYDNADKDVLEDIDFVAKPGQTTAIIGSTGSGKSTLIHLIPRFYDVTGGKITIDGRDIRDYTQHNLREAIGFVPQKGVLFSGDVKSNLSFGCEGAPMEQLVKAAQIAQADEFIEAKPDKYDSPIAQGGTNVSGGQKQRLSIARAIAKKPKILLFDDSFSALDFKTDVTLRKALGENIKDCTVLIVAQRIVTIMNADNIIVLDEGKIAGQGTHMELIRNCPVYTQIVKSQLSEAEFEAQLAQAAQFEQGKEVL